jgi:hypothetical protein
MWLPGGIVIGPAGDFPKELELGDRLEVLGAACSALGSYERIQVEHSYVPPEDSHHNRVREQILIPAAADDLAEQIETTRGRDQGEVQSALQRSG